MCMGEARANLEYDDEAVSSLIKTEEGLMYTYPSSSSILCSNIHHPHILGESRKSGRMWHLQ